MPDHLSPRDKISLIGLGRLTHRAIKFRIIDFPRLFSRARIAEQANLCNNIHWNNSTQQGSTGNNIHWNNSTQQGSTGNGGSWQ